MFFAIMNKKLPSRELLILDEAHMLETEIVRFRGISISRKKWRKYIPDLRIDDHCYDVKGWLGILDDLRKMMLDVHILRGNEELLIELEQDVEKLESVIEAISINRGGEGHSLIELGFFTRIPAYYKNRG